MLIGLDAFVEPNIAKNNRVPRNMWNDARQQYKREAEDPVIVVTAPEVC